MVKFTERDIAIVAGLAGAADFLTEGRFSAPVARALKKAFRKGVPVAARGAVRFAPRALGTARFIAMRHPVIFGLVVTYEVYKHREKIAQLAREGWEIVDEPVTQYLGGVEERGREFISDPMGAIETQIAERERFSREFAAVPGRVLRKRKPSKFNLAVKAGMKAIKKSTSYGGKGIIKPAKKAFALVTKLASAKKKKKKAPKSGIRRRIWNAMKGLR